MKVVRLSPLLTGHLYPQEIFLVLISVRGWVNSRTIVWPEVLCQWEILWYHREREPATFQLVERLNLLHHLVSQYHKKQVKVKKGKAVPLQASSGPEEVKALRLHENGTMVVGLSGLRTGHLYPKEILLVLVSVTG